MLDVVKRLCEHRHRLWRRLTRPLEQIDDPEQQQARQLASVVVWSAFAVIVVVLVDKLVLVDVAFDEEPLLRLTLALAAVFGLVLLRQVVLARWLYLSAMHAVIYAMWAQHADQPAAVTLGFLPLLVMIAGTLVAFKWMVALAVANQAILLGLDALLPHIPYMGAALLMNGVFSTATCIITLARQREQRQLRESEQRYRQLLEINFEPIVITGWDRRIRNANTAFEAFIGLPLAQIVGRTIDSFTTPESQAYIARMWGNPEGRLSRVHAVKATGEEVLVEVRTTAQRYAGEWVFVMAVRDLSRETAFERERREYELRYEALFEHSNDGVFIVDLDGRCLMANQRGLDMLGITLDEYRGRHASEFVEEREESLQVIERLKQGEVIPSYLRHLRHVSGRVIPVELTPTLVRDSLGRPLHLQSITRDISERLRSQEERLALIVQRERTRVLRQLIDDFSHHVRTPLSNIKNSAYLLCRLTDPERQQRHQQVIDGEIARLVTLLDDLLMLTRLEQEADARPPLPIDLNEALVDLLPQPIGMGPADPDREWRFEPAAVPPIVFGDRARLLDGLRRIVDNARNYTPAGGRVRVQIHAWEDKNLVRIRVADTGIGIPPEDLPHIFETFYRTDAASERSPLSTGLGLSICRKIVEMHRGVITVESAPAVGTTFNVWLPMDLQSTVSCETLEQDDLATRS